LWARQLVDPSQTGTKYKLIHKLEFDQSEMEGECEERYTRERERGKCDFKWSAWAKLGRMGLRDSLPT
jgi:hypothetical protein